MASAPPCAHSLGHPLSPRACAMERVVFESLPMRRTLLMSGSWFWVLMITAAHQLKRSFPIAVDRNKKNAPEQEVHSGALVLSVQLCQEELASDQIGRASCRER